MNLEKLEAQLVTGRLAKRFWPKVDKRGDDDCWNWKACVTEHGYGRMTAGGGVNIKAPRASWMIHTGRIIENGLFVLHCCDNPACVNPKHLFLGTQKENMNDMDNKGRRSNPPVHYGENHRMIKFGSAVVTSIRNDTRRVVEIAKEHSVSINTIYRIKKGESRAHG